MQDAPEHHDDPESQGAATQPALDRGLTRRLTILASGAVLALVLIVIIINLGSPQVVDPTATDTDRDPIELIAPKTLSEQQLQATTEFTDLGVDDLTVEGGWIQVTDDEGLLAQQYRFARVDPNPDKGKGWAELASPEAELFLSDNRVVVLKGTRALAYLPNRALESGSLFGEVVIHLYELDTRRSVEPDTDTPSLVIRTDEAQFDSMLGEVYCPGEVTIEAPQLDMPGRELRVLLNDRDDQVAMRMASVSFIRIKDAAGMASDAAESTRPGDEQQRPATAIDPTGLYRLTLSDNLQITQRTQAGTREVTGDRLTAVFSTASSGLGDSIVAAISSDASFPRRRVAAGGSGPMTREQFIAALVIGAAQDSGLDAVAEVDQTVIRFDGPMVLEPWSSPDPADLPALLDSEDAIITISGEPVRVLDSAQNGEATGTHLTYQRSNESIELLGTDAWPVVVSSPDLTARGERFEYTRSNGHARFTGSGWLAPEKLDLDATRQDAGSVGDIIAELQITWQKGVDLRFDESNGKESIGAIREVHFTGDVKVESKDGNIYTEDLQLLLKLNEAGKPTPDQMIALGDVKTTDTLRTMWADRLTVDFEEMPDPTKPRINQGTSITARVGDDTMIRNLNAQGDVQIRLPDGSRAFADELIGDGVKETLELKGEHVVIVAGTMLIDRGKSITFDAKEQTGHWAGPGQFFNYDKPIDTSADERIERPVINHEQTPPLTKGRWNESMDIDNRANDGGGQITLDGDVFVESRPSAREYNRLEGQQVTLVFRVDEAQTPVSAQPETDEANDLFASAGDRQLDVFIARGLAKLENRLWQTDDQSDKPRVFYVAARCSNTTIARLSPSAGDW